ncbi:MAG: hypothetical protein ACYTE8_10120 [Planctomycetota bacterium]|jgi:hypothetical protein
MVTIVKNSYKKKLYERIGFSKTKIQTEITERNKILDYSLDWLTRSKDRYDEVIISMPTHNDLLGIVYYYFENVNHAKKYARKCIDYTLEYFFGSWRKELPIDNKPPDAAKRKEFEPVP